MIARAIVCLGVILLGALLLLERPKPMAIAPSAGEPPTRALEPAVPQQG